MREEDRHAQTARIKQRHRRGKTLALISLVALVCVAGVFMASGVSTYSKVMLTIIALVTSALELYLLHKQDEALAEVEAVDELLDLEERYESAKTAESKAKIRAEIDQKSAELSAYQRAHGEETYEEYRKKHKDE